MPADSSYKVVLVGIGEEDDEASFRLQNTPGGEMQRRHILQQEASALALQADLAGVIHGTLSPDGPAASILLLDLKFHGSQSHGRRFRQATIDVGFAHSDDPLGSDHDPEVISIAPCGNFQRSASSQEIETTVLLNLSANLPGGFATAGGGWERTKMTQKTSFTTLNGMKRIEERSHGTQNAARWQLTENDNDRHGIPAALRVAMLIKPKNSNSFRAIVTVDVKVNPLYAAAMVVRRFRGKTIVDPVYFDDEAYREPLNPEIFGDSIDPENLAKFNLESINSLGPSLPFSE